MSISIISRDLLWYLATYLSHDDVVSLCCTQKFYLSTLTNEDFWFYHLSQRHPNLVTQARKYMLHEQEFDREVSWKILSARALFWSAIFLGSSERELYVYKRYPVCWGSMLMFRTLFHNEFIHRDLCAEPINYLIEVKRLIALRNLSAIDQEIIAIDDEDNLYYHRCDIKNSHIQSLLIATHVRRAVFYRDYILTDTYPQTLSCGRLTFLLPGSLNFRPLTVRYLGQISTMSLSIYHGDLYLHLVTDRRCLYCYLLEDNQLHFLYKVGGVLTVENYDSRVFTLNEQGRVHEYEGYSKRFLTKRKYTLIRDRYYIRCSSRKFFTLANYIAFREGQPAQVLRRC